MRTEIISGHLNTKIEHTHQDAIDYNLGKELGAAAFARGVFCAAMDEDASSHLRGRAVGQSAYFLKGWNVGNTQARLAA